MKNLPRIFAWPFFWSVLFLIVFWNIGFSQNGSRAIGYSLEGELKTTFWNNGVLCGSNFSNQPGPEGYFHQYQYLPKISFILGLPGKDPQGTPYPWAMRPAVDSLSGQIFPDSIIYWGPTVSESWFDRTDGWQHVDWEPAAQLFSGVVDGQFRDNLMNWISPLSQNPLMAHSNRPATWPGFWPGFWGWNETGQVEPGRFFSDEDIYWEMTDDLATRDVDPTQGYPTGIRVKAQVSAFRQLLGGIIFYRFRLVNHSPWNYKDIYSGIYFDADVYHRQRDGNTAGRSNDDDMMQLDLNHQLAMIWDPDDNSNGTTGLAFTGIGLTATPPAGRELDLNADGQPDIFAGQPAGVTGWHWFDWFHRPGAWDHGLNGPFSGDGVTRVAVDKEAIQYKLMAGDTSATDSPPYRHQYNLTHYFHPAPNGFLNPRFDSNEGLLQSYPDGLDCVFILSTGPFNLDAGDSTEIVAVLLAADDSLTLRHNATVARDLWQKKFIYHQINLTSGNGGEVFSGGGNVSWQVDQTYPYSVSQVDVWLGRGDEPEWRPLSLDATNTGSVSFNTADWPDGAFYRAIVLSHNGPGFVTGISDTFFTINNPNINVAPDFKVLTPSIGDTIQGLLQLKILAADADGDSVLVQVEAQMGSDWLELFHGPAASGFIPVDTRLLMNGKNILRISVSDNAGNTSPASKMWVIVNNVESLVPDSTLHHISGSGNGRLQLDVVDPSLINGHTYEITFSPLSDFPAKVTDLNTGTVVVPQINYLNRISSNVFDGLALKLQGFDPPQVDSSYWKIGNSDWSIQLSPSANPNPADYLIEFGPAGFDTVFNVSGTTPLFPVSFRIYNTTYSPQTPLELRGADISPVGQFNSEDLIYLFEEYIAGQPVSPPVRSYRLFFFPTQSGQPPQAGDLYRITTIGYFTEADTIRFKSPEWLNINGSQNIQPLNFALFPNYPNPFNPATTIRFAVPQTVHVKLEIFNLLGQKVRVLKNKPLNAGIYEVVWDGRSDAGIQVASGVYIYRLTAGNHFTRAKKLLLLR